MELLLLRNLNSMIKSTLGVFIGTLFPMIPLFITDINTALILIIVISIIILFVSAELIDKGK